MGITNSLIAELWAVREGLNLARKCNIQYLIVELDALVAVNLLLGSGSENELLTPIVVDCRKILREFRGVRVQHNYREGNMVADTLAKMGRDSILDVIYFETPPREVMLSTLYDAWGCHFPRTVHALPVTETGG